MKMAKTLITALFAVGMLVGFSGMASAAAISCGGCHGDTTKTPAYESHGLPTNADNCAGDARGLHGVHGNYSSASYAMSSFGSRGTCSYCHTSSGSGHPTATHDNGYINITGSIGSGRQNWDTTGLDYDQPSSTCTNACHKNEGASAKWGNYTATTVGGVKLTCNSCHDDSSASTMDLSGAHSVHLLTNISTHTTLDNTGNAMCDACHPDNTSDLWSGGKADDGTKKAYPHASDGTNVVSDNAEIDAGISATKNGLSTTCANACHNNTSTAQWGDSQLSCNACHDDTGTAGLLGRHATHINAGKTCSDCHAVPSAGDTSHVTALPVVSDNATVTPGAGTFNDAAKTCTATGGACHGDGTTTSWYSTGTQGCVACHNYPDPAGGSLWAVDTGHAVQYDTSVNPRTHLPLGTLFNYTSDTYATVIADTTKCGKCHSGATHRNGSVETASTGIGYNNCGTGDFTINVNTSGSDVTCSNVSCHSGKTTPNWY